MTQGSGVKLEDVGTKNPCTRALETLFGTIGPNSHALHEDETEVHQSHRQFLGQVVDGLITNKYLPSGDRIPPFKRSHAESPVKPKNNKRPKQSRQLAAGQCSHQWTVGVASLAHMESRRIEQPGLM